MLYNYAMQESSCFSGVLDPWQNDRSYLLKFTGKIALLKKKIQDREFPQCPRFDNILFKSPGRPASAIPRSPR